MQVKQPDNRINDVRCNAYTGLRNAILRCSRPWETNTSRTRAPRPLHRSAFYWCLLIGLFLALPSFSQESDAQYTLQSQSLRIDWATSTIQFQAILALNFAIPDQLIAPQKVQHAFNIEYPSHFESLFRYWTLDSLYTIEQEIELHTDVRSRLTRALSRSVPTQSIVSEDFTTLTLEYSHPIYPFVNALFKRPAWRMPLARYLPWMSSQDYTGIVIYAQEPLPLVGTSEKVYLRAALFPEIYDEALRPVLLRENYDESTYESWGPLAYTSSLDETPFVERIGLNPLRIVAAKVNGIHPSDIVLNTYDARRILHSEHTTTVLQKGRILVIINDDQFTQ